MNAGMMCGITICVFMAGYWLGTHVGYKRQLETLEHCLQRVQSLRQRYDSVVAWNNALQQKLALDYEDTDNAGS